MEEINIIEKEILLSAYAAMSDRMRFEMLAAMVAIAAQFPRDSLPPS